MHACYTTHIRNRIHTHTLSETHNIQHTDMHTHTHTHTHTYTQRNGTMTGCKHRVKKTTNHLLLSCSSMHYIPLPPLPPFIPPPPPPPVTDMQRARKMQLQYMCQLQGALYRPLLPLVHVQTRRRPQPMHQLLLQTQPTVCHVCCGRGQGTPV